MCRRAVAITLLCLMTMLPCSALSRTTPEHVPAHIQAAIQNRDLDAFERNVAIDTLVSNSLEVLMRHVQSSASANSQNLPPALTVMALAASSGDTTLRDLLRSELARFIRYGVSAGLLNGQKDSSIKPDGMLAPLLANLSTGKKILRSTGKARKDTRMSGAWLVPVEVYYLDSKHSYPFTLHAIPAGDDWQVDGITDVDALLTRMEQHAGMTH